MTTEHERIVVCTTSTDNDELARIKQAMNDFGIEVLELVPCRTIFRIDCHEIDLPKLVINNEPHYMRFIGRRKKGGFRKYT